MNKMTVVDGWINCEIGLHFFSEALFSKQPLRQSSARGAGDSGSISPRSAGDPERFSEKALPSVTVMQLIACVCNTAVAMQAPPTSENVLMLENDDGDDNRMVLRRSRKDQPASLFTGNPSEIALVNFFEGFRPGVVGQLRSSFPVVFQIPFNSKNKVKENFLVFMFSFLFFFVFKKNFSISFMLL